MSLTALPLELKKPSETFLKPNDLRVLLSARDILEMNIPTVDGEILAYIKRNISSQDKVSSLKAQLAFYLPKLQHELRCMRLETREMVREESSRTTQAEVDDNLSNDPVYREKSTVVVGIEVMIQELSELMWCLKQVIPKI